MAAPKTAPDAAPAPALGELVEAWMVQLEQAPAVTPRQLAQGLQAAAWRALGAALAGDAAKAPAAAAAAVEAAQVAAALLAAPGPSGADWLSAAAPQTPEALARLCWAASARAAEAALTGDPSKAAAAVQAAVQTAQAGDALVAPVVPDSGDAPVTEAEVVASLRRAVRRGLGSDDPRRAVEALALWRQERALLDPDGVGAAGEAEDAALAAEVEAAAERARAAGLAMVAAGEVGR